MKTLLTSLVVAVTAFFVVFAVLTLRSTGDEAALFWQLERMAHNPVRTPPSALNQFAATLHEKVRDPDLKTCAGYQYRRSSAILRLGLESYPGEDDSVAVARLLVNGWRRPSGLLLLTDAMSQERSAMAARLNCLTKFSRTEADRTNAVIAGLVALLTFPMLQLLRHYRVNRAGIP